MVGVGTVLVVCENNNIRMQTVSRLKSRGYDALGVGTGFDAMIKAKKIDPDILYIDIIRPVMDAFNVADTFRKSERLCGIPIVMAVDYDQLDLIKKCHGIGVNAFLPRPVDFDKVNQLVQQMKYFEKDTLKDTILIADDDKSTADGLGFILRKEGYNVLFASNGLDAIDKAQIILPQLIIMDYNMPGCHGLESVKQIRSMEFLDKIPIVGHTSHVNVDIVQKSQAAGCDLILRKPADIKELSSKIRMLLQESKQNK